MNKDFITIVSGLPRSGTSMMMKMLEAGGMELLVDHIRTADADNPKGYFEFEKVKQLTEDQSWLGEAQGKAVKVISALLNDLPEDYSYKVIFMRRKIDEILASQKQMLIRRGEPADTIEDGKMAKTFFAHVQKIEAWLAQQPNMEVLYMHYHDVLQQPLDHVRKISNFLGDGLDFENMARVIDRSLYRQRR